jgi:hypothetical protein
MIDAIKLAFPFQWAADVVGDKVKSRISQVVGDIFLFSTKKTVNAKHLVPGVHERVYEV